MITPNVQPRTVIRPIEPPPGTILLGQVDLMPPQAFEIDCDTAARHTSTLAAIQDGGAVH
ncbi:MAG: hypothetical protein WBD41_17710 [Rhodococcus sp. (in: high G+C Gram-positive bacteria)]